MMNQSYRVSSVVGARPQFVKLGPVHTAFAATNRISHRIIHTGQHYDDQMSAVFFDDLGIPKPDVNLAIGSGRHGVQTGSMLQELEAEFVENRPDAVVVYGDTNSTLAATLAASKMHIPIAHVEAGLRSFDRKMPEEINRLVADHCSDKLYAPTPASMRNLTNENLQGRSVLSGDIMRDAVIKNSVIADVSSSKLSELGLDEQSFGLVTIHRPSNTDSESFVEIIQTLDSIAKSEIQLVYPVHPRVKQKLDEYAAIETLGIRLVEPLAYLDMLALVRAAMIVITDSGGLQKEAAFLKTPCVTLRSETEWVETVELGVNRLAGSCAANIRAAIETVLTDEDRFSASVMEQLDFHYGTGSAADAIAGDVLNWLDSS